MRQMVLFNSEHTLEKLEASLEIDLDRATRAHNLDVTAGGANLLDAPPPSAARAMSDSRSVAMGRPIGESRSASLSNIAEWPTEGRDLTEVISMLQRLLDVTTQVGTPPMAAARLRYPALFVFPRPPVLVPRSLFLSPLSSQLRYLGVCLVAMAPSPPPPTDPHTLPPPTPRPVPAQARCLELSSAADDTSSDSDEPPEVEPRIAAEAEQLLMLSRSLCREAHAMAHTDAPPAAVPVAVLLRVYNLAEQLSDCMGQLRAFWGLEAVAAGSQSSLHSRRRLGFGESEPSSGHRSVVSSGLAGRRSASSSGIGGRYGAGGRPASGAGSSVANRKMYAPVTIDSFEILKHISRGAYGHVVLAAKKTTRDLYAIKVVRKSHTRRKNNLERIKTERQVLASAEHPFVVSLYYSFQSAKNLYMVMEFVNGGDLYSLLQNVGYLEEDVTCLYVAEIGLALHYLHSTLGVVHRDIKPENVLIHQDGHIKLTDFGLSVFGLSEWPTDRPSDDYHAGGSGTSSVPSLSSSMPSSVPPSEPASVPGSGCLSSFSALRVPDTAAVQARPVPSGLPDRPGLAAPSDRLGDGGPGGSRHRGFVPCSPVRSLDETSASVPEDSVPASPKGNAGSKRNTPLSSPRPALAASRTASPRLGTSANPMRPPPAVPAQQSEMRATVGTPDYMAPELLLSQYHGKGVDLWALGCLTFELLTGYTPFTAGTVAEVFENILEHTNSESIRWPGEEGHLSPHAVSLIRELLHPLPERRLGFDSIDELCNHPFFDDNGIDWELLLERQVAVPFVPAPEASDDVSYFVPKPQPASGNATRGGSPRTSHDLSDAADGFDPATGLPTPAASPMPPRYAEGLLPHGSTHDLEEEFEDPDFIPNFAYENLNALRAKNMEQTERASGVQGASSVASPGSPDPDMMAGGPPLYGSSRGRGIPAPWKEQPAKAPAADGCEEPHPAAAQGEAQPWCPSAAGVPGPGGTGGAAASCQQDDELAAGRGSGTASAGDDGSAVGNISNSEPGDATAPPPVPAHGSSAAFASPCEARPLLPMDGVVYGKDLGWGQDPGRNDSPAPRRRSSLSDRGPLVPAAAGSGRGTLHRSAAVRERGEHVVLSA
jgi:serine/threonine protein kinase